MKVNCLVWWCLLFILIVYSNTVASFNVEGNEAAIKYLPGTNVESAVNKSLSKKQSSFYGYKLKFTNRKELVISSPKWTEPSSGNASQASGSMEKCRVTFTQTYGTCDKTQLGNRQPGDNFGLAVDIKGNRMRACSPSKVLKCKGNNRAPGFCYESSNNGRTWSDMKSSNPKCPEPEQKLDIIFVLDGSASVMSNFKDIKRWTKNMAAKFDIEEGLNQIGVVFYSSLQWRKPLDKQKDIRTEIRLGEHTKNEELFNAIGKIKRTGSQTYTARGISKTVSDFKKGPRWSDKETRKIMVVLTDGDASDPILLPSVADRARSLGIILFAVGVGDYNITQLRIIATGNESSDSRVLSVESFDGLDSIVKKLSTQILQMVLEGSGSMQNASYKMEMGQSGFAMDSSSRQEEDIQQ